MKEKLHASSVFLTYTVYLFKDWRYEFGFGNVQCRRNELKKLVECKAQYLAIMIHTPHNYCQTIVIKYKLTDSHCWTIKS